MGQKIKERRVISGVEWLKLWNSLTSQERRAVILIKESQEQNRKRDFYAAKVARGDKLPKNWDQ